MADNRPIGVFDSGIGGLTVLREIIARMPNESTVYFGDNGRTPYGTKSHDTIVNYCLQNMKFLEEQDVKMIVIACNTASVHSYSLLKKYAKVPVVEVVYPGAMAAARATVNGKVGIIATSATVDSGVYETAVRYQAQELINNGENTEALNKLSIIQQACPLFVSLAEEGWWDDAIAHLTAERYLAPLKEFGVDTVVLACTHYPLLAKTIQKVMGPNVTLINSGISVAGVVERKLVEGDMLSDGTMEATRAFYTSDDAKKFESVASPFLGRGLPAGTKKVIVDKYDVSDMV